MNTAKTWFWVLLDILIAVAVLNVVFFVMPAIGTLKNSFSPARTLTVTAQGMTTATPDMAEITFSVVTQGADPAALSNNNNAKMSSVLQFVSSQGIASSDIATTGYNLQPNYIYDNKTQGQDITGYTLTQTVQVKIRDLTKVASTLGGLAPLGVNEVGSVDFTFQNPNTAIDAARTDALTNAKTEAQNMASEAGAALGAVVNVQESSNVPFPRPVYATAGSVMSMVASAPTLEPGTQDVTDNVTVTYQLK